MDERRTSAANLSREVLRAIHHDEMERIVNLERRHSYADVLLSGSLDSTYFPQVVVGVFPTRVGEAFDFSVEGLNDGTREQFDEYLRKVAGLQLPPRFVALAGAISQVAGVDLTQQMPETLDFLSENGLPSALVCFSGVGQAESAYLFSFLLLPLIQAFGQLQDAIGILQPHRPD